VVAVTSNEQRAKNTAEKEKEREKEKVGCPAGVTFGTKNGMRGVDG
jgi:hypothetical protein